MIKCPFCLAENPDGSVYCGNCGASLNEVIQSSQQDPTQITEAEMGAFVGDKAHHYLPKFKKFSGGSKVSFNVPVFLLGFLLGPLFSSFWFFHRKMKKIGAIVLLVSLLISAVSIITALPMMSSMKEFMLVSFEEEMEYTESFDDDYYYDDYYDDDYMEDDYYEYPKTQEAAKDFLATTMSCSIISIGISMAAMVMVIIISIYADYWYYQFAIKSVYESKRAGIASNLELSMKGGTSAALWATTLVAYIVLCAALYGMIFYNFFNFFVQNMPM